MKDRTTKRPVMAPKAMGRIEEMSPVISTSAWIPLSIQRLLFHVVCLSPSTSLPIALLIFWDFEKITSKAWSILVSYD